MLLCYCYYIVVPVIVVPHMYCTVLSPDCTPPFTVDIDFDDDDDEDEEDENDAQSRGSESNRVKFTLLFVVVVVAVFELLKVGEQMLLPPSFTEFLLIPLGL